MPLIGKQVRWDIQWPHILFLPLYIKIYDESLVLYLIFFCRLLDGVWNKTLISKLFSIGICPYFCTFVNLLSGCSITAVVDSHCSFKLINIGVSQSSVLSPTLFLLFTNDIFSCTYSHIQSYTCNSTLFYSIHFIGRPSQRSLGDSRNEAVAHLTSDLSLISDWSRKNIAVLPKYSFIIL